MADDNGKIDESQVTPYTEPKTDALDPSQMTEYKPVSPPPPPESDFIRRNLGEGAASWVQRNIQDPFAYESRVLQGALAHNPLAYYGTYSTIPDPYQMIPKVAPKEYQAAAPPPEPPRGGLQGGIAAPLEAIAGPLGPINALSGPTGLLAMTEPGEIARQEGAGPAWQAGLDIAGGLAHGGLQLGLDAAAFSPRGITRDLESSAGLPKGSATLISPNTGTPAQSVVDAWNKHLNTIMKGGSVDPNVLRYTSGLLPGATSSTKDFVTNALSDPAMLRSEYPQLADHIGAITVSDVAKNPSSWTGLSDDLKKALVPSAAQRKALDTMTSPPGKFAEGVGRVATGAIAGAAAHYAPKLGIPHVLMPGLEEPVAYYLGQKLGPRVAESVHTALGGVPRSSLLHVPGGGATGYLNWQQAQQQQPQ